MGKRLRLLGLAGLGLACTGCDAQTIVQLSNLDLASDILHSPGITSLVQMTAPLGQALTAAALSLLCLYLWYRANEGLPWISLAKELFIYGTIAVMFLSTAPLEYILNLGLTEGQRFSGDGHVLRGAQQLAATLSKWMSQAQQFSPGLSNDQVRQALNAFLQFWTSPYHAMLILLNGAAFTLLRQIYNVIMAVIVVIAWVTAPYVSWTVVLPQTRHIFKAWLLGYISVCTWPLLMGIFERIAQGLPWEKWMAGDLSLSDPLGGMARWGQGQLILLIVNLALFVAYSSLPIISYKTVMGQARSAVV
jgi:hypothetical protein